MTSKGPLSPDANPAYGRWEVLPASLWETLREVDFSWLQRQGAGLSTHDAMAHLPFLGDSLIIDPANRSLSWKEKDRAPTFQEGLVALIYLTHFKPIDLSRKWISPLELPGGRTFFGTGSHPPETGEILKTWAENPTRFYDIMDSMNADRLTQGDAGFQVPALPMVPLRYIFWKGDPSLPPAVTLLVNATAHLFLPLDVLWALINLTDRCFESLG